MNLENNTELFTPDSLRNLVRFAEVFYEVKAFIDKAKKRLEAARLKFALRAPLYIEYLKSQYDPEVDEEFDEAGELGRLFQVIYLNTRKIQ